VLGGASLRCTPQHRVHLRCTAPLSVHKSGQRRALHGESRARVTGLCMCMCAACLALLTAAALDLNYYLLGGGGLPWIDPANATQPGINVDVMLLLIALALCAANAQVVLQRRRTRHVGAGDSVVKPSHQARA